MDLWYFWCQTDLGEFSGLTIQKTRAEAIRFSGRWLRSRGLVVDWGSIDCFVVHQAGKAVEHWRDCEEQGMAPFRPSRLLPEKRS